MDFKNKKPGRKDNRKPQRGAPSFGRSAGIDEPIDASPGDLPPGDGSRPRNIRETKAWQQGSTGVKQFWANYIHILRTYFINMPRTNQEQLITRVCMIVTMGAAVILVQFFYGFLPMALRLITLPVALVGSWWLGTKIVSAVVIVRLDQYLNRDF